MMTKLQIFSELSMVNYSAVGQNKPMYTKVYAYNKAFPAITVLTGKTLQIMCPAAS